MSSVARNHHYLPQGYLGSFSNSGTREGQIYVFDLATRKTFRTRPRNIAAEKDFNRIEVEGQSADFLESSFASMEGRAIEVMRDMGKTRQLAKDEDLVYVMNLICLLVVRNPRARRSLKHSKQHSAKVVAGLLVSNKGVYENHLRKAREDNYIGDSEVSYEKMKAFVQSERYTIEIDREALIRTELSVFDEILKYIGTRYWSLLDVAPEAPDLITSDHPIVLMFKNPRARGPIGVGLKDTEMIFPIGPRQALRGVFEDPFNPVVSVRPKGVAALNASILRHADRQIYSREPKVSILSNGEVVHFSLRPNK